MTRRDAKRRVCAIIAQEIQSEMCLQGVLLERDGEELDPADYQRLQDAAAELRDEMYRRGGIT